MSTMEELAGKFRVRVIKQLPDTRVTIAGAPFINPGHPDHDGTRHAEELAAYAIVPAHTVEALKANNKHYIFSDPFTPSVIAAPTDAEKKKE